MTQVIVNGLVSFLVTALAKTHTRLAGTKWLNAVNLVVSLLGSVVMVWQGGSTDELSNTLTVIINTCFSYGVAWATHKLAKMSYK